MNFLQDWKLVSSVSATERIKLWNRFSGPIDQDTVKAEFFRKVHSKNPPFRYKLSAAPKERIQIPPMIAYHYQNPPSLLPTLRDVLRCEAVYKKGQSYELIHEDLSQMIEDDLKAIQEANRKCCSLDETVHCAEKLEPKDEGTDREPADMKPDLSELPTESHVHYPMDDSCSVDDELNCLDASLIKMLAFQRLQQILHENPKLVAKYQQQSTAIAIRDALMRQPQRNMPLPSQLLTKDDIARIAREFTSPQKDGSIARTRSPSPIRYFDDANSDSKRIKLDRLYCANGNGFEDVRTDEEKAHEITTRLEEPILHSKIRARAVIIPVGDILSGKRLALPRPSGLRV